MKRKDIIGIVICLVLTGIIVMLVGCDKPYLPGDYATALDMRIIELRAAEKTVDPECAKFLALDREYLEELQKASR